MYQSWTIKQLKERLIENIENDLDDDQIRHLAENWEILVGSPF